jgi:hypothetical protein
MRTEGRHLTSDLGLKWHSVGKLITFLNDLQDGSEEDMDFILESEDTSEPERSASTSNNKTVMQSINKNGGALLRLLWWPCSVHEAGQLLTAFQYHQPNHKFQVLRNDGGSKWLR